MAERVPDQMPDQGDPLARIAAALERLAPPPLAKIDWLAHPGYLSEERRIRPITQLEALPVNRLKGIDRHKQVLRENIRRLSAGHAAHDMLLWGARGMGKSALLRACVADEQVQHPGHLALIELDSSQLGTLLPELFEVLRTVKRRFVLFLDDLAFDHSADQQVRHLRSALEGSLAPRPANVRLAITSNHRAILARGSSDQADALQERDWMDDSLALADRFGVRLGFHPCSQEDFLAIVDAHAAPLGLAWDAGEALAWSRERGPLSGRSAWQFVVELAGRAGRSL
ncbi:MAG: DUF815 domain-containing protein [Erythrobacter sp.]